MTQAQAEIVSVLDSRHNISATATSPFTVLNQGSLLNASADTTKTFTVLLAAVADHLDRSDRMLTEIMNGPRRSDISTEQAWAEDLLTTNRLYRQDALDGDERAVAGVLDELERSLLEIAHTSSHINQATLDPLRQRIDAAALLFKVRVMSDQLRQRASIPAERIVPYTSTRTPS